MFPRPWPSSLPLSGKSVALICLGLLAMGLIGHDPWKTDDAVSLNIARSVFDGHWLIPQLAGETWLRSPPLFYWLLALFSKLFSWLLPWHDAARLASLFLASIGLTSLAYAARTLQTPDAGRIAPLLVIGTLGLLVPIHDAQPAVLTFASLAVLLGALAAWRNHPIGSGIGLGVALGTSFLGGGFDSLALLFAITLACAAHPRWRRESGLAWLAAIASAVPILAIWPIALVTHSSPSFNQWWAMELTSLSAPLQINGRLLEFLAWSLWPLLPLGFWSIWLRRKHVFAAQNYLPSVAALVTLTYFLRGSDVTSAVVPMIAAWALLATPAAQQLRRGAANAFDWFSMMTLSIFIALAWLGGIAILTGLPEPIAKNFSIPAPGFVPQWSWPALSAAVLITLAWLRLLVSAPRSPWRPAVRWACGVVVVWALLALMWLPWINYTKSYRIPSAELRLGLGNYSGCIERKGLGAAQRASLDYFDGIRTLDASESGQSCRFRIVQSLPADEKKIGGWRLLVETSRPGDKRERLRLYRRNG